MARATLKQVVARKHFECAERTDPVHLIEPGMTYWNLSAFRRVARYCPGHMPSEERVSNFAPKSRADRAASAADSARDAAGSLDDIASEVRSLSQKVEEMLEASEGETLTAEEKEEAADALREGVSEISTRVACVSYDLSDVESLAEEMGTWRDGMSGTGLENTSKYSEVDECASELEGIEAEPAEIPSLALDAKLEDLEAFADECEEASSELERAADEIEGIDFPGMY